MAQRVHLPNFASLPNCEVVALAEVRRGLGERVRRRYGIPRLYPDHRGLIDDPEVDAIAVSAPFALQGEVARECLQAGKPVFMEKPMAISVAQAVRILDASRAGRARLMVAYMKRFDPGNELVRAMISAWRASAEAGRILYARAHGYCGDWTAGINLPPLETPDEAPPAAPTEENLPDWLPPDRARGYLAYLQQYTHNVNLLRFFLDAGDRVRVKHADLDADGYTGVVVLDVDGVRATLETGSLRYYKWDEHTQVYFERGWVHTWAPPLLLRNATAEVEIYRSDPDGAGGELGERGVQHTITRPIAEPRWGWAYQREAAHFVDRLLDGTPFRSSAEDALADVRLFEDIFRAWLQI
jgi:predicted dehydrogenase